MAKRRYSAAGWIGVSLSLVLAGAVAAAPQQSREEALESVRDEIAFLSARLSALDSRRSDLRSQLKRSRLELELREGELREAILARQVTDGRLAEAEAKVAALEVKVERLRADLRRCLIGLYRFGRHGYFKLLLSVERVDDLMPGIRQLRYLTRRDATALENFIAGRAELAFERDELRQEKRRLAGWIEREERRRAELVRAERRLSRLLADAEREQTELTLRSDRLIERERKLSALIDSLVGRSPVPLSGTAMQEFRGVLDWPVNGAVRLGFGPRADPHYRTQVPHNGLAIEIASDPQVRAIFPGKVLYAASLEGYDLTVVVHHPGRVFSLYAGLEELGVGRDDMLDLGDVVGRAGSSLYFEIREENRPQDPLDWLR